MILLVDFEADENIASALSFELSGAKLSRAGSNAERVGSLLPLSPNALAGHKYATCQPWIGVLNDADITAILDHLARQPWSAPERIQVLIRPEDASWFGSTCSETASSAPTGPIPGRTRPPLPGDALGSRRHQHDAYVSQWSGRPPAPWLDPSEWPENRAAAGSRFELRLCK